ncbi:hypothetical protein EGW08_015878, partial [Elysia chlorotica]
WKKVCSLIGAHLITSPLSFIYIYGNLIAYVDSYLQLECSDRCLDADTQWILAFYVAGQFPGAFIVQPLLKKVGPRWSGMITMLICNAAIILSAWTLQHSVLWTVFLYGLLVGPCAGISSALSLHVVNTWSPMWAGFFMATVTGYPTVLSLVQNQVITSYVNPDNLEADKMIGLKTYFSQPQLLNRAPIFYSLFLFGVATEQSLMTKAYFYKEFGQIYINNDKFLTLVGSIEPIISTLFRIMFGALLDIHILSIKQCILYSLALNSVLCFFWYFVPQVSALLYLFLLLSLSVSHCLLYVVWFCAGLKLFGQDHLLTNFGLITSFLLVGSLITPIVVHVLLGNLGWFWLF